MSASDPVWRRLHPAAIVMRWFRIAPQIVAGAAAYAAAMDGWGRILLVVLGAGLMGLAVASLGWWRFRFAYGGDEIVIESGVFQRQRRVIPYDRIQDIAIERPPIARLAGAARVKIETGGASTDEGRLDLIGLDVAAALRDQIRIGQGRSSLAAEAETTLFEMSPGRLLYSGLFNFSLLVLAFLVAILQNLDQFGLIDLTEWATPARADAAWGLLDIRASLILGAGLLLLGLISGIARTGARDFGFRLTASEAGLRRSRGLFTLSEMVIPLHRAQVAVIESGPFMRLFGWYRLSFQTLGADQRQGGLQTVAPFARSEEIALILAATRFPDVPDRGNFRRSPRRALIRRILPLFILAVPLMVSLLMLDRAALIVLIGIPLLALIALLRWQRRVWVVEGGSICLTAGLLKRRISIIPLAKMQTLSLRSGPVQRRLRLATLHVDTAGASMLQPAELVDLDREQAQNLNMFLLDRHYRARAAIGSAA